MKNWMIELEEHVGPETAQLAIGAVAACVTAITIIIGNWYILV